jgi:hypothetical protein
VSEHVLIAWARRDTPAPDQIRAAEHEAERLESCWAQLRALEPGAAPDAEVTGRILAIAGVVGAVEARVHAGAGPWARQQRLALKAEASRLVPSALGSVLNFPPEWSPL